MLKFQKIFEHNFKKNAFTLAEVLITLGIIGVVAALTLPTLIQNHKKQVYVTGLKKAYSTLQNVFNKMAVDEGVVEWKDLSCVTQPVQDNYDPSCFDCYGNHCISSFYVLDNDCYNKFKNNFNGTMEVDTSPYSTSYYYFWMGFATSDGITYLFDCCASGGCSNYSPTVGSLKNNILVIAVDVNGVDKKPNKLGRDLFAFFVDIDSNKVVPVGAGEKYSTVSPDTLDEVCGSDYPSADCTAKVLLEGKMNY